eukprot:CAMPEP_0197031546 /NCGR_PEP_ID=MMETSP1384-20130603/10526_1 /TAXON_ID=29189 /ORGANISM="Ammonia sp." /LENGTH=279 /DNA_ID=CAMNT_0042461089 /DNA_START=118 /DNA_END=957 /DNA_ORIENTATION=+
MLITSFVYVEYDEYAFKKSTTTNKVDQSQVYDNGRYLWGFNHKKVAFPKLFQLQELNLSVSNVEGVSVNVAISFWYRLPKEDLSKIYSTYGTNYETQLVSIARAAVRNTAVIFSVNQFLNNRTIVRDQIAQNVSIALEGMNIDCPAYTVQLNEIEFSATLLATHLNAAITLENNLKKEYEKEAAGIRAETDKLVEEYTANTTIVTRTAEANKTAEIETAQAKYDEIIAEARGIGLATTMEALGIVAEAEKARFLKLMAILDNSEARIIDLTGSAIINLS